LLRHNAIGNTNEELVAGLKDNGVLKSATVEEAMLKIPRGEFVTEDLKEEAYIDTPLRIASMAFNISAPHMYAVCLEQLNLQPGMSFLDIGSGSGHFTALAAYLVGNKGISHGIDIRQDIVSFGETNCKSLATKIGLDFTCLKFFLRNCFLPTINAIQYDRIHVGACCPEANLQDLVKLLKPNGILVTPLLDKMVKVTKLSDGKVKTDFLMSVRYGDLIIPSEAEVKEAQRAVDREKKTTITVPESTFVSDMTNLLNNPDMSDVKLIVENKPLYAHRTILGARCEHFSKIFTGELKNSKDTNESNTRIALCFFSGLSPIYLLRRCSNQEC